MQTKQTIPKNDAAGKSFLSKDKRLRDISKIKHALERSCLVEEHHKPPGSTLNHLDWTSCAQLLGISELAN